MSFFYVVSQTCFSFFIPLFLHDAFSFKPRGIGLCLTLTSLVVFLIQVVVYRPLESRVGLKRTGLLGALAIFMGLALVSCANERAVLGAGAQLAKQSLNPKQHMINHDERRVVIPEMLYTYDMTLILLKQRLFGESLLDSGCVFYAFGSATFPATVPTVLAKSVPKNHRGRVLGWDSLINNIGRVLTPLVLGAVYGVDKSSCFFWGGASSLITLGLLCRVQRERAKIS